jgi:hypothetical protein
MYRFDFCQSRICEINRNYTEQRGGKEQIVQCNEDRNMELSDYNKKRQNWLVESIVKEEWDDDTNEQKGYSAIFHINRKPVGGCSYTDSRNHSGPSNE